VVFAVITVAEFVYSVLLCYEEEFIALLFIAKAIEIPLVLLAAINMHKVQKGAKRLAEGDLTEKVDTQYLVGPFKKHAEYLNAVNDGVNRAVSERMKSESMKTELITNVSHDLKTPLTSIINYVDLLKGTDIQDEKALEYIDVIDRQSQKLKKLCADVVDASKAATGSMKVNNERTALNVLLGQMAGEYHERLKAQSLTPIAELPERDVYVYADGRLLWRVFDNLMNNVCKYAMPGTRVYLTLSGQNGHATVTLRNISGSPLNIPPEEITERFVRGDSSRNTEGSGLGLSIAKSMTELMGGTFHIDIDGDLFKVTITFPVIQ
jgi:signal transduction histidine kinase